MGTPAPASLRRTLLWRLGGLITLVLLIGAGITIALARHSANGVFDQWLYDSASTLAAQVDLADPAQFHLPPRAVEMFEFDVHDRVYYEVMTDDGRRIFGNALLPPVDWSPAHPTPRFYDTVLFGRPVRVVALHLARAEGVPHSVTVQVAETTNKREGLVFQILLSSLLPLCVLLVLAGFAVWFGVRGAMDSLDQIAARLGGYRPGSPSTRLPDPASAPTEVRPLLQALQELVAKLADAQAGQQRFIANASHQLRTPLAALQVQAERALREPDPVKHSAALESVLKSLTRLRHLAHQLLMLARAEPVANESLALQPVDLAALTRQTLERWTDRALDAGADLGYEGPASDVVIQGQPQLLEELIGNLVDNAIRYGGPHARITVTVVGSAPEPALLVDDEGSGIPEDERALVLERFYRRGEGQGAGLGLPIAVEIAARHGAALAIRTPPGSQGTRVEIRFPATAVQRTEGAS